MHSVVRDSLRTRSLPSAFAGQHAKAGPSAFCQIDFRPIRSAIKGVCRETSVDAKVGILL